jgi:cobalt-zinc-cadmium efflux system membrane fusion protein
VSDIHTSNAPIATGESESPPKAKGKLALVAVVLLAAIAMFFILRKHDAAPKAEAVADVPKIDGKAIVFSPGFAKRSGIAMSPVEKHSLVPVVQVVGTATFDAEYVGAAGTRIRGFVRKVLKVEGDDVKKGDALAEIESAELGSAQAEVVAVMAKKKAAERNAKREAALLAGNLTTAREEELARSELEEQAAMLIAATQKVNALGGTSAGALGTYLLRAPLQGTVVKRMIAAGQSVESDLIAFRVADLDHLWVELAVYERDIGGIHVGDTADITASGNTQIKIAGKISHVGDVIDPDTRTTEVRIKIDNLERALRPGQSVVARVHPAGLTRTVLTIPVSAVTYVDGKPTVFVADTDTRVLVAAVKLGQSDGERQEVVEGLADGQRVVSAGVFALKSELFR